MKEPRGTDWVAARLAPLYPEWGLEVPKRFNTEGLRMTNCCGAFSKCVSDRLVCKDCWCDVGPGEGDGAERKEVGR